MSQQIENCLKIEEIQKILADFIRRENILEPSVKVIKGNVQGDGYMGIVNVIELIDEHAKGKENLYDLVIKKATRSAKIRDGMPIRLAFLNEMNFYQTIYPEFCNFHRRHQQLAEDERSQIDAFIKIPQFFGCNRADMNESLILENMRPSGYQMWDRMVPMDDPHIKLILTNYSRLHSVSFAMKAKDSTLYASLTENMPGILDIMIKESEQLIEQTLKNIVQYWDGQIDGKILQKVARFAETISEFVEEFEELHDDDVALIHGDSWNNNILFKYDDASAKPTDACFIDFQLCKRTTPTVDLCYFLCTCSSPETLANLPDYLDFYYGQLAENVNRFECDCRAVYPRHVFDAHCKRFFKFGLLMGSIIVRMMLSEQAETPSYEKSGDKPVVDVFFYKMSKEDEYMRRMRGVIEALGARDMI